MKAMSQIKKTLAIAFLCVAILFTLSCVSTPYPIVKNPTIGETYDQLYSFPENAVSRAKTPSTPSKFMQENVITFETRTLDNGIKLVVKKNPSNRVYSMKLVMEGGSALQTKEQAGIEGLMLAMLARGSKNYNYETLSGIMYEKSSAVGYFAQNYDWASFDINTIDKYWDEVFAVYSDCLLNPAFDPKQWEMIKNNFIVTLQENASDAYTTTTNKLHQYMFSDHLYGSDISGTIESVSKLTLDDIKAFYDKNFSSNRMTLVAVGNFDTDKLVKELNSTIGTIPNKNVLLPQIEKYDSKRVLYKESFPQSKGIAYVRGDFPIPPITNPDFASLQLASTMLNELLFSVVRTDNGACYSVWENNFNFKNPYGSFVIYKTTKPTDGKHFVDEAIALLASGKTLNIKGGEEKYASVYETIEAYKAKFINSFFASQETNAEMASQIVTSLVYQNNETEYLRAIDKINAITADDIISVVNTYYVGAPISWIVLSDDEMLKDVEEEVFTNFSGTISK